MTESYKLMIHVAHSLMVMYSADVVANDKMTVAEFRDKNPGLCEFVFSECIKQYRYELSHEQVSRAILVFLQAKYYPSDSTKLQYTSDTSNYQPATSNEQHL